MADFKQGSGQLFERDNQGGNSENFAAADGRNLRK
jgi:hypothetical protein